MRNHPRPRFTLLAVLTALLCLLGQATLAAEPTPAGVAVAGEGVTAPPGAFAKNAPENAATGVPVALTLLWQVATGAASYEYCYDMVNNAVCDAAWSSTGSDTWAVVTGLALNTTYYWQTRAVNPSGATYADGDTWWSFTTTTTAPPNDDFDAATVVSGLPFTQTQAVAGATTAADDPNFTCVSGQKYRSVWFRYTAPSAQAVMIDTTGSTYDTVLAVWTGSRGSLISVACNDDFAGNLQSTVELVPSAGTTYYIEVASYNASSVPGQLTINAALTGSAPAAFGKTDPPTGTTGLGVAVYIAWDSAARVIRYEYCFDTVNNGACDTSWMNAGSARAVIAGGVALNTTYYWQMRAVNSVGSTYADAGTWWSFATVPSAPDNDDFDSATTVGALPITLTQNVAGAATAVDDPVFACSWGKMYRTVWFRYTAPVTQTLAANTTGSDYDTLLAVWTGSRGSLTSVACNDDTPGVSSQSRVEFTATAGTTYYIEVASYGAAPINSQLTLNLGTPPGGFGKIGPPDGATGLPLSPGLSWGMSSGATAYEYCVDMVDDDACNGSWISTGLVTGASPSGLAPNTEHFWQVRAVNAAADTAADGGTWWRFTTGSPVVLQMSVTSEGAEDGWVLERDEDSTKGGLVNATATTGRLGDNDTDFQYRSILSFNTSGLPDDAVVIGITIRIKRQSITGTNPFGTHGLLKVDMQAGYYNDNPIVERFDFHAVGSRGNVGRFIKTPSAGWYRAPLRVPSYALLNLTGNTQFRLRFDLGDNDDMSADYLAFYTGDANPVDRPELIVDYYVP